MSVAGTGRPIDIGLLGDAQRGAADHRRGLGQAVALGQQRFGDLREGRAASRATAAAPPEIDDLERNRAEFGPFGSALAQRLDQASARRAACWAGCVSRSSRKPASSKRGSITTCVPLQSGTFMQTVIAKMWKNGRTATTLLGG